MTPVAQSEAASDVRQNQHQNAIILLEIRMKAVSMRYSK